MKLSMRPNLVQQQGAFKMKHFGYLILPMLIFSSGYAHAGILNGTADDGTACSSSSPMMTADGSCRATPSKYVVTIYEMGVCSEDPFNGHANVSMDKSSCSVVFQNSTGFTNDYAASIGTAVAMTGTSSRPANGTYKYPYMIMKNEFTVNGSFTSNGTTYYSTGSGSAASSGTAAEYTDTLRNFGGPKCYSGYPDATIAGVGTISAYLVNSSLVRADEDDVSAGNCTGIDRMVGMMNLDAPFTISENTVEFSYSFILTDFGIQFFDESGSDSVPDGFGSGPFSGKFTIVDR